MKQLPLEEERISFTEFRQFLFDAIIPIEAIVDHKGEPIAKILPFWRKKGLVPYFPSGKHKVMMSCADLIWIRILDTLRQFSYPIEKQLKVTDYFFRDAYNHELPKKNFQYNQQQLHKKKLAGTITPKEQQTLDFIEQHLDDEVFLYVLRFQINYLTNLITNCLDTREERRILLFMDGRVAEEYGSDYYTHADYTIDPSQPHLTLSVKHLLREFFDDKELRQLIVPHLLTEDEKTVLQELKTKNLRELTIYFKDEKPVRFESTKTGVMTGEQAKKIREILGLSNYEKITLDTLDEKSMTFKKTRKKINRF